MSGKLDWAKNRPPIMSDAVKTTQGYLDNVWKNFDRWCQLRGFSQTQAFQQVQQLSRGEVKMNRIRRMDSEHNDPLESEHLKAIVFVAKIMRVNALELMAGEIDFRKL